MCDMHNARDKHDEGLVHITGGRGRALFRRTGDFC